MMRASGEEGGKRRCQPEYWTRGRQTTQGWTRCRWTANCDRRCLLTFTGERGNERRCIEHVISIAMVISLMHLTRLPASTLYHQAAPHASAATTNVRGKMARRTTTTSVWTLCLCLLTSRVEVEDLRELMLQRFNIKDLHDVGGGGRTVWGGRAV